MNNIDFIDDEDVVDLDLEEELYDCDCDECNGLLTTVIDYVDTLLDLWDD